MGFEVLEKRSDIGLRSRNKFWKLIGFNLQDLDIYKQRISNWEFWNYIKILYILKAFIDFTYIQEKMIKVIQILYW